MKVQEIIMKLSNKFKTQVNFAVNYASYADDEEALVDYYWLNVQGIFAETFYSKEKLVSKVKELLDDNYVHQLNEGE